jgi:mRNA-degrading endonuclease HigB of HigAB toxin-antitoxin module
MKQLFITAILCVFSLISTAQTSITCKSRETCWWNVESEVFDICSDAVFDNSLFVMNENEDMLVHKTSDMTSTYYVTSSESEEDYITYEVVSDVGNEYTVFFDVQNMLVKFMGTDDEGDIYLTMYAIKSVF